MFKEILRQRPKHLLAVYVEERRVEVVRAHRQWRNWRIDTNEAQSLGEGDNVFEFLQRLNLKPRDRRPTALILILPRSYYSFHREHYPISLKDQLEEALVFDWQDNVFYETEHTLHFAGPAVTINHHLSVPIFALQRGLYEKLHQALGAALFSTFAIIPSALAYKAFSAPPDPEDDCPPVEFFGRFIDPRHVEINRYYMGNLLDSILLGDGAGHVRMFLENVQSLGNGTCGDRYSVQVPCAAGEGSEEYGESWKGRGVPVEFRTLPGSILSQWVKHFLEFDQVATFEAPLLLKPWQVPKVLWALLALVVLYSTFAFYEVHSLGRLQEKSKTLKRQVAQSETQWKPVEELQARINKFLEDKKTLSQFHAEGYPLLEIITILTRITPGDTWINYLSLRKGQLILRGESKSAIKYLPELSKVEGFTDVRFASPVTRNPTSNDERFNLQLQIDPEKLKKTIASLPPEPPAQDTAGEGDDLSPEMEIMDGDVIPGEGAASSPSGDEEGSGSQPSPMDQLEGIQ